MKYTITNSLLFSVFLFSCYKPQDNSVFFMSAVNGEEISVAAPPAEVAPPDLLQFVQMEGSNMKQHFRKNEFTYSAFYKPVDYIICKEERSNEIKTAVAETKRKELNGMQYVDLRISADNIREELLKYKLDSTSTSYEERVKYCSFAMQNDIKLVEGKDTIPCAMLHFEREYNVTPYLTFLMAFPANEKTNNQDKTLLFNDKLFNNGIVRFVFNNKSIQNIPKLKTI